jgi:hypothetical protein
MDTELSHGPEELEALDVLSELQTALEAARMSLAGQTSNPGIAQYVAWCAMMTNRAADGYLSLRKSLRVSASKLLVRPAIESTFRTMAVIERPGFLLRIARTEIRKENEFIKRSKADIDKDIAEFERQFSVEMSQHAPEPGEATILQTAQAADLEVVYQTHYRVYCQYAHGSLRAMEDDLDAATNPFDTPLMCWCVIVALGSLKDHTPAAVPDLQPFLKRVNSIWPKDSPEPSVSKPHDNPYT